MSVKTDKHRWYTHHDLEVLNFVDHPIWIFDLELTKKWWANTAALEFWNARTVEELTSRNFAASISEQAHRKNLDSLERLKRNETWVESWTFFPDDDKPKTALLSHCGIRNDQGKLCCFVQAKLVEEKAGDPFIRDSAMLRYLPIAVSQFDADGNLMYQNPEACYVFGTPGDAANGDESDENSTRCSSIEDFTETEEEQSEQQQSPTVVSSAVEQPQSKKAHLSDQENEKDGGGSSCHEESKHDDEIEIPSNHFFDRFADKSAGMKTFEKLKAGEIVTVEALLNTKAGPGWNAIHACSVNDSVSNEPIILFTARDISEIVNAKKETQLNLERAEFFAIMAHEIRTPLFQVTGNIDLLNETTLDKEQRDYINSLNSSTTSLMAVINDVLDYSKLEAGEMKLNTVPFEPKSVIAGSLAAVALSLEEKGVELKNSFASEVPVKLMGDPNRLRQILLNLLQNAAKFTHQGNVEVSVDMIEEDYLGRVLLKFAVKDTGIGIDSNHLSDIFQQYNQADPSIATVYGGTGLGLFISKGLVTNMGGSIGVVSSVGKGSTFWFQVPFDRPEFQSHPHNEADRRKEDFSTNLRILVAEDNVLSQKLVSKMLARLGHEVTIVENGEEAVKEVQKGAYDLILMDIQMPVMDGIDATKEIRSLGFSLPIIGLTASVRRDDFQNIGLNDWIGKPVRLKELQKKISQTFNNYVGATS